MGTGDEQLEGRHEGMVSMAVRQARSQKTKMRQTPADDHRIMIAVQTACLLTRLHVELQ